MKNNVLIVTCLFVIGNTAGWAQEKKKDLSGAEQQQAFLELMWKTESKDVKELAQMLESKDVNVRRKAAQHLYYFLKWGAADAIPALTKTLRDPDANVRTFSAGCFRFFGSSAAPADHLNTAVPILAELMTKDESDTVRGAAAVSLRHLTFMDKKFTKDVVPAFVTGLQDKDSYVRSHCACTLGKLGECGQKPFKILADLLRGKDEDIAGEAMGALGDIGMSSLPTLTDCLKDKNSHVRRRAIGGFLALVDEIRRRKQELSPEIISLLLGVLEDSDKEVSIRAMTGLAHIGPQAKKAIPKTMERLKDMDWTIRRRAAMCLMDYGSEGKIAIPALRKALQDEEEEIVRQEIERTLKALDK